MCYELFQIFYIDATWPRFSTPLHDAVCCGRQEVVRLLLERGAEVNEVDYKLSTPLRLAIRWVVSRYVELQMKVCEDFTIITEKASASAKIITDRQLSAI